MFHYQFIKLYFVCFVYLFHICYSSNVLGPLDRTCKLYNQITADSAEYRNIYEKKVTQKCTFMVGGSITTGVIAYSLNSNNMTVPISGIVTISKRNLDQGTSISEISKSIIRQLTLQYLSTVQAGQVLGSILGGPGDNIANVFPQSIANKNNYDNIEKVIHDCLSLDKAKLATIRWNFKYLYSTDVIPNLVQFRVFYTGGQEECSKTRIKTFQN